LGGDLKATIAPLAIPIGISYHIEQLDVKCLSLSKEEASSPSLTTKFK
jgi:hypothetical protein